MSNWNNWSWERSIKKNHSSGKRKAKNPKKFIRTVTRHVNFGFKPVAILFVGFVMWELGEPFIDGVFLGFLFNIMFTTDVHEDIQEREA